MKIPTMQESLTQVSSIVQDVKATKAEHMYLEQCILALTEAVRVYTDHTTKQAPQSGNASLEEALHARKKSRALRNVTRKEAEKQPEESYAKYASSASGDEGTGKEITHDA